MPRQLVFIFVSLSILLAFGCAGLQLRHENPVVNITSFKAVPTEGAIPKFEIGLHIINPNRRPLELKGVAYSIALEGYKIITGVSNQLPMIDAYDEGNVTLTASVDFFSSIGFITDLMRNQGRERLAYSFSAKLDTGILYPLIRVTKKGEVSLTPSPASQ